MQVQCLYRLKKTKSFFIYIIFNIIYYLTMCCCYYCCCFSLQICQAYQLLRRKNVLSLFCIQVSKKDSHLLINFFQARRTGIKSQSPSSVYWKMAVFICSKRSGGAAAAVWKTSGTKRVPWASRIQVASSLCWPLVWCCQCLWQQESSSTNCEKTQSVNR